VVWFGVGDEKKFSLLKKLPLLELEKNSKLLREVWKEETNRQKERQTQTHTQTQTQNKPDLRIFDFRELSTF
jgi:hypothetical protein